MARCIVFHFESNLFQPDITGPGVGIIAAFSQAAGPSNLPSDTRRTLFNVEQGTSMACPHVAGIAGLLKTYHPTWSPAAIKSAIMTTGTSCLTKCFLVCTKYKMFMCNMLFGKTLVHY